MFFNEFAPKSWFLNKEESTFWLRIYTSLIIPHDKFIPSLNGAMEGTVLDLPVAVTYLTGGGYRILQANPFAYAGIDGTTVFEMRLHQFELAKSNYVFVLTPLKVDGNPGFEHEARRRLDMVSAIIRAHAGKNFLKDVVFEAEVDASKDTYSTSSPVMRTPQRSEGPFIHENNWIQMTEIFDRINILQRERKNRIKLALEFLNKAIQEEPSFFYYWTALEVVCNGKSQKIRECLKRCYSLSSLGEVDSIFRFRQISNWRHEFFHKGAQLILHPDVERYIQLLFLDLLRQEVDLPVVGHLQGMLNAKCYDLSQLGLGKI